MCGIAGFLPEAHHGEGKAQTAVQRMCERLRNRGPDADGLWASAGVVLGHRRLAILDLDARATQPMLSSDGRYSIVFNGEIYNFRELRQALESDGATFRTTSDTEILLMLFAREGEAMLPKLRGMFAFAIWDTVARELFLARDPYGIKPLYYAQTKEGFLFASQVKGLLASGIVPTDREAAGLVGFYLWGSVPEPWTLYRNVFALPAGHWLRMRADGIAKPVCWHDIRNHWREPAECLPAAELQERVRQAVTDSVRAHLVADVPVSVFLSGGIDSGAVAALIAESGERVEGITIGFQEFSGQHDDETPVAAAIAKHYGMPHHVRWVSRQEFDEDVPKILDAMDQPSIDGVNTWFASKAVAERGYKVVLSGLGGDELLAGYPSFSQVPRSAAFGRIIARLPGARAAIAATTASMVRRGFSPKIAGVAAHMETVEGIYFLRRGLFLSQELQSLLEPSEAAEGLGRLGGQPVGLEKANAKGVAAVGLLESTIYMRNQLLRDSDWASMAHSLELRTPLVDSRVAEQLAPHVSSFVNGAGKKMLGNSPATPLPESIINRRKTGFSIPMGSWLVPPSSSNGIGESIERRERNAHWGRRWSAAVLDTFAR